MFIGYSTGARWMFFVGFSFDCHWILVDVRREGGGEAMRHWLTPYPPTECFLLCSELSPANPGRDAEEKRLQQIYLDAIEAGKILSLIHI